METFEDIKENWQREEEYDSGGEIEKRYLDYREEKCYKGDAG